MMCLSDGARHEVAPTTMSSSWSSVYTTFPIVTSSISAPSTANVRVEGCPIIAMFAVGSVDIGAAGSGGCASVLYRYPPPSEIIEW